MIDRLLDIAWNPYWWVAAALIVVVYRYLRANVEIRSSDDFVSDHWLGDQRNRDLEHEVDKTRRENT